MTDWFAIGGVILGVAGILATIIISLTVYARQKKDGVELQKVVNSINLLTQQKVKAEEQKKTFECQRIIQDLQELHQMETDFKEQLTNYQGEPTNEWLKFSATLTIIPISQSMGRMKDAMGQLQWILTDNTLRGDFLKYLNWFNLIPKRILEDDITDKMHLPGQEHLVKGLIRDIDEQMEKIQGFVDRFTKEMKKE